MEGPGPRGSRKPVPPQSLGFNLSEKCLRDGEWKRCRKTMVRSILKVFFKVLYDLCFLQQATCKAVLEETEERQKQAWCSAPEEGCITL